MSCFVMNPRALAAVAQGIETGLNVGYNFLGLSAPESLGRALEDCADKYHFYSATEIYRRLYDLNARAYNGRYYGSPADPADTTPPDFPEIPAPLHYAEYDPNSRCRVLTAEHFRYIKLLDCLIYQCCEDATINDPLYLALREWLREWQKFVVRNNPLYEAAEWGEY